MALVVLVVAETVLHVLDVMVVQDVLHSVRDVKVLVMDNVPLLATQRVLLGAEVAVIPIVQLHVKIHVQQHVQQIVLALALLNVLVRQLPQYNV